VGLGADQTADGEVGLGATGWRGAASSVGCANGRGAGVGPALVATGNGNGGWGSNDAANQCTASVGGSAATGGVRSCAAPRLQSSAACSVNDTTSAVPQRRPWPARAQVAEALKADALAHALMGGWRTTP
jgi:hypothetical protein